MSENPLGVISEGGSEHHIYGAAKLLRVGGGSIWLPLSGSSRRDIRDRFTSTALPSGVLFDSDNSTQSSLPTIDQLVEQFQKLNEREIIAALGSNPFSMENELASMIVRDEPDWEYLRANLYTKVLIKANVNSFLYRLNPNDRASQIK
jgi:hypothetical protein